VTTTVPVLDVQMHRRRGQVVEDVLDLVADALVADIVADIRAERAAVPRGNGPSELEANAGRAIGRPMALDPMDGSRQ
jgi:hypothetical protein